MMRFKYNSDCTLEERIELVSKEIIDEYHEIPIEIAKKIATIDDPIDDKLTNDDVFKRYYKILLFLNKEQPIYYQVLKDMYEVYCKGLKDERLVAVMQEIMKYVNKERFNFPLLSEFYS